MSKFEKSILRLKSYPRNWTWNETRTVLKHLGYEEIQGRGSRVRFFNEDIDDLIHMHKPHPGNILREYQVKILVEKLIQLGLIEENE